ncbi:MAG: ABC transporter ATP-binding protein [Burkholderiales bacterium]|nr:ABC transporter ATP-binding protein [Burkholderiales bacterium]
MSAGAPLLNVFDLTLTVPNRTLCAGVSFIVHRGECWVIVGPNGAGKTTLLATLAGLRKPAGGTLQFAGRRLDDWQPRVRAKHLGFLPQDTVDAFPDTALDIALAGRHPHAARWRPEAAEDVEFARAALAAVGMADHAQRNVQTLSGGERRRVAIAMLLAQDPDLMLLDEPTNHLDVAHEVRALDLVSRLARDGRHAVVMALHDLTLAARYATHAVLFGFDGVTAGTASDLLTAERLSALYGQKLVAVDSARGPVFVPA